MTKHIHKTTRDGTDRYNKNISSEDEWSHIAGEVKQQESSDPLAPKERIIAFTNKYKHITNEDLVREKSSELKDQMSTTDQYFKFANELIRDNIDRLNHLKENEQRFLGEVNLLQNKIKSRYELEKINPKYATEDDAKSLLSILEEECEKVKDRLLYQELIVQRTKDEIAKKRDQINKIRDELKKKIESYPKRPTNDPILTLKDELVRAGVPESDKIFQLIDELSGKLRH